ncbi:hypothetical protein AJ85_15540 [Alkalihalobacillus alcalophilus ATCC 27647 = CGMCC 1.3604]|uniref:NADP-dependent oxidoreductase domain-containing protein n=1 Tax=Alkalihalobacillus alcalophilus ATCC 27647 = CGMCC 1.3604 TaxID=1218173 RepID=A0A4V3X8C2_ALKAL|nr:hypothetical protein AJ85_15540 [Alkalihalobacillus alcalophilus ATCC 27647 = CGMCC 1.3604]
MLEALRVADQFLLDRIVVNQPMYHMFHRDIENEVIPFSEQNGISQIIYSPLAQGVLSGKYKAGMEYPKGSRAADDSSNMYIAPYLTKDVLTKVERLQGLACEQSLTLSQLALAWVLRHDNVASTIIGASKPEQVLENVKAIGVKLSTETIDSINKILN